MNPRRLSGMGILVLVGAVILVARLLAGCAAAAEATYGAQLGRCVKDAKTREESRACRDEVDRRWGVYAVTERDGGR